MLFCQQAKISLPAAKMKIFKEQIVINYTLLLRTVVRLITSNYGFCRFALKLWYIDFKKICFPDHLDGEELACNHFCLTKRYPGSFSLMLIKAFSLAWGYKKY